MPGHTQPAPTHPHPHTARHAPTHEPPFAQPPGAFHSITHVLHVPHGVFVAAATMNCALACPRPPRRTPAPHGHAACARAAAVCAATLPVSTVCTHLSLPDVTSIREGEGRALPPGCVVGVMRHWLAWRHLGTRGMLGYNGPARPPPLASSLLLLCKPAGWEPACRGGAAAGGRSYQSGSPCWPLRKQQT